MRAITFLLAILTATSALAEQKKSPAAEAVTPALVQLQSTAGFRVRDPSRAYGTSKAVKLFTECVAKAAEAHPSMPVLSVGDMSQEHGGRMRPHRSHRDGRDIDVGFYFKDGKSHRYFERATPKNLDVARTWSLVRTLLETREIEYIFLQSRLQKPLYDYARKTGVPKQTLDRIFQFPHGRRHKRGIIRHERGHDDHLHIRFKPERDESTLVAR